MTSTSSVLTPPGSADRGRTVRVPARVQGALRRAAPALALYAGVRLVSLLYAVAVAPSNSPRPWWAALAASWDSKWYTGIAAHGYGTTLPGGEPGLVYSDLAFFPLFPAAQRTVSTLLHLPAPTAGLVAAWLSACAAAWGIYAVGERLYGRRTGTVLVVLWGVLPHAFVQTMAYSESLMTALAAWSLYAVLARRWLWAGSLALLCGVTRPNAVAVAAAVSCTALYVLVRDRWARRDWRIWTGAALAPLGWLGYVGWVGLRSGEPLGYFTVQAKWGSRFDFGVSEFDFLQAVFTDGKIPVHLSYYVGAAGVLVGVVALILLAMDRPPLPVLIYTLVLVVIAVGGSRYYACKPRFLLPAFPLLIPAAMALTRTRPRTAAVLVSAFGVVSALYGAYALYYTTTAP